MSNFGSTRHGQRDCQRQHDRYRIADSEEAPDRGITAFTRARGRPSRRDIIDRRGRVMEADSTHGLQRHPGGMGQGDPVAARGHRRLSGLGQSHDVMRDDQVGLGLLSLADRVDEVGRL